MPATYAHLLIAETIAIDIENLGDKLIPKEYQNYILENSTLIQAGSLCPDLPFLDEAITKFIPLYDADEQQRWGDLMHYINTGKIFIYAVNKLREIKSQDLSQFKKCLSWFLGFASHMIADAVVHPVVEGIVGLYHDNPDEHRYCEMHQDVWLCQTLRKKDLINYQVVNKIGYFNDSDIKVFWEYLLRKLYEFYFLDESPRINEWFADYRQKADFGSSTIWCVGRYFKFTYPQFCEINLEKYIFNLKTPNSTMHYLDIVNSLAIPNILEFWRIIIDGIENKSTDYESIHDFDLDTGKYYRTNSFVAWR